MLRRDSCQLCNAASSGIELVGLTCFKVALRLSHGPLAAEVSRATWRREPPSSVKLCGWEERSQRRQSFRTTTPKHPHNGFQIRAEQQAGRLCLQECCGELLRRTRPVQGDPGTDRNIQDSPISRQAAFQQRRHLSVHEYRSAQLLDSV